MPGRRRGKSGDDLIDRTPQNLPMQLGGLRVVRRMRRTSSGVKWWRRNSSNIVASIGLITALGGAYLATTRPTIPAYVRGSIFIGGSELKPVHGTPGLYVGDAAMYYFQKADKSFVATASTFAAGKNVAGRCVLIHVSAAELRETCDFWIGTPSTAKPTVSSVDIYDLTASTASWKRHYSDGVDVDIVVPASAGGVVPVPLPVGR